MGEIMMNQTRIWARAPKSLLRCSTNLNIRHRYSNRSDSHLQIYSGTLSTHLCSCAQHTIILVLLTCLFKCQMNRKYTMYIYEIYFWTGQLGYLDLQVDGLANSIRTCMDKSIRAPSAGYVGVLSVWGTQSMYVYHVHVIYASNVKRFMWGISKQ